MWCQSDTSKAEVALKTSEKKTASIDITIQTVFVASNDDHHEHHAEFSETIIDDNVSDCF